MTPRELVLQTLNQYPVPRVPRDIWYSSEAIEKRADDVRELMQRFPADIVWVQAKPAGSRRTGSSKSSGENPPDSWGCTWGSGPRAPFVEPSDPPLADAKKLAEFRPPRDWLDERRFDHIPPAVEREPCFVLAQSEIRPFERLRALRGTKAVLADLSKEKKPSGAALRSLLATIHQEACREIELWCKLPVDGVMFGDVWGSSERLLIEPQLWREVFKPLYQEYCRLLHEHDKFAFFLSGGNVYDIVNDLVKIGVDAFSAEWGRMSFQRLVRRFAERITFWGGLDRPDLLRTAGPVEVRQAVQRLLRPFADGHRAASPPTGAEAKNAKDAQEKDTKDKGSKERKDAPTPARQQQQPSAAALGESADLSSPGRSPSEEPRHFSIIAQCCFDVDTSFASMVAFCEQWFSPLPPR